MGMNNPIRNEPEIFANSVAHSLHIEWCVIMVVSKYRAMLPKAPPAPTNNMFFIIF